MNCFEWFMEKNCLEHGGVWWCDTIGNSYQSKWIDSTLRVSPFDEFEKVYSFYSAGERGVSAVKMAYESWILNWPEFCLHLSYSSLKINDHGLI